MGEGSTVPRDVSKKMSLIIGARRHLEWGHEKYIIDTIQSHHAQPSSPSSAFVDLSQPSVSLHRSSSAFVDLPQSPSPLHRPSSAFVELLQQTVSLRRAPPAFVCLCRAFVSLAPPPLWYRR